MSGCVVRATWRGARQWGRLALLACLLASCAVPRASAVPQTGQLRLAGATSMYPLAEALIAAYAERQPQVNVQLETRMWRDGVQAVRAGRADIGLVARDLPSGEALKQVVGMENLVTVPIGLDGVVIVVNSRNPVKALSLDQLRRLYTGELFDWGAVGGRAADVEIVMREDGADTRQVFEARAMAGQPITLEAVLLPSNEAVAQYVKEHEQAIGYLSPSYLRTGIKALFVEGISPDKVALRQGTYPLSRPLFLVTAREPEEPVRSFVAFVLSPAGQAIVDRYHVRMH